MKNYVKKSWVHTFVKVTTIFSTPPTYFLYFLSLTTYCADNITFMSTTILLHLLILPLTTTIHLFLTANDHHLQGVIVCSAFYVIMKIMCENNHQNWLLNYNSYFARYNHLTTKFFCPRNCNLEQCIEKEKKSLCVSCTSFKL